jgi:hypothetical protein
MVLRRQMPHSVVNVSMYFTSFVRAATLGIDAILKRINAEAQTCETIAVVSLVKT